MSSSFRLKELELKNNIDDAVKSAVLIFFYPENGKLRTVFILRTDYNGVHARQVSFPGGRVEESDHDIVETALREAHEEVNIDPDSVQVLGKLSNLYIPPSNFLVTPIVGCSNAKPNFIPDKSEVDKIIKSDLSAIFDKKLLKNKIINVRGYEIEAPYFDINGYVVWGATAMMLSELKDVIESIPMLNI